MTAVRQAHYLEGLGLVIIGECRHAVSFFFCLCFSGARKPITVVEDGDIDRCVAEQIANHPDLWLDCKYVNLSRNGIGDRGAAAVANVIGTRDGLIGLNLSRNDIESDGAHAIARMLCRNSRLNSLNMAKNKVGYDGALAIFNALSGSCRLQRVDLADNRIGLGQPENVWTSLFAALQFNCSLSTLLLDGNSLQDSGALALAATLAKNSTLYCLSICHNAIGWSGTKAIARSLSANKTLATLRLAGNRLGAKGAHALAKSLAANCSLKFISLANNDVGPRGAKEIAAALPLNRTLKGLNLNCNSVGTDGAQVLFESLQRNKTLSFISLEKNAIDSQRIVHLLKPNLTLHSVCLYSNDAIDRTTRQQINALISRNKHFATVCDVKALMERTTQVCSALRPLRLPIHVICDFVDWEFALRLSQYRLFAFSLSPTEYYHHIASHGRQKRVQWIERICKIVPAISFRNNKAVKQVYLFIFDC